MTPRDEILGTGRLGREGAELLYRAVRLVAVGHGFPPPEGAPSWNANAVAEAAHDFLQDERGARRLRDIAVRSVDDQSFQRLLDKAILNFLRDKARRTDLGKLILRIKEILRDEPEFDHAPGYPDRWMLVGGEREPSTVPPAALASSITSVSVVVPKWSSARRDAPLADRPSFIRLMTRVLSAAEGSLTADDVARALTSRLDHRRTALATTMDIQEHLSEPAPVASNPAARTVAELHAVDVFNTLSDRERIILTDPEATVRDLADRVGVGKSQADLIRRRLFERLRNEFADAEDADRAITRLCELCQHWSQSRTEPEGATSDD